MVIFNKLGEGGMFFFTTKHQAHQMTDQNIEASFVSFFCILQMAKVTMP